jgi:UDP-3-O-[3-hydroxymyristoyl] glucosamine N-acyltransferase
LLSGGRVVIDNVGIGAFAQLTKGYWYTHEGTKIDNQVHVGHDTVIGKKCLIASQTYCVGWRWSYNLGTSRPASGITIEKSCHSGQTGVTKSVEGGVILEPHRRVQRKVKATCQY